MPKGYSEAVNRKTDREYNDQKKRDKKTMIYKAQHRKLKIEQHEPN